MAELLLELLSEEIPARMQAQAAADLRHLVRSALAEAGLEVTSAEAFATPRRLTLAADGLPARQPDRTVERRGPRVDAPRAAIDGFLKSLAGKRHTLEEREERKGRALHAVLTEPGRASADVLASLLPDVLARLPWPKSMRWGDGDARWVRPLQAIVCLLDGEVVPFAFAGVSSGDRTRGHRFLAPGAIRVRGFADYKASLEAAKVLLDPADRRRLIAGEAARLAEAEGLRVRDDPRLLDEVAGLVEWPVVLMGRIDPDSMALPPEVLTVTMRTHQRYLAVEDGEGRLAPLFITVANMAASDGGAAIVAGNERVLRARLWDARFFWEQDRKVRLEDRLPALDAVVFHEKLGSLGDKVRRLERLAAHLAGQIPGASVSDSGRAARLCKCDLKAGMVGEFPELQGVMGGYYARAQGEPGAVAAAVADHYAPKGPDDRYPSAPTSVAVALADRLDTLVGFFAAGIRPTGSGDPFALRRAALGVIRLVVENGLRLPLRPVLSHALGGDGYRQRFESASFRSITTEILKFFAERLAVFLRAEGIRHDLIAAAFAVGEEDDLVRLIARARALQGFVTSDDGASLLVLLRRASNIVAIEERRDGVRIEGSPDPSLLREAAERALFDALSAARRRTDDALDREDYIEAMAALAGLRGPVDAFFDAVMVNVPEPELRRNRLRLLALVPAALGDVADFGLIEDAA